MTKFTYPQNDLDSAQKLLSTMGSFWATSYQGNKLIEDLAESTGQLAQETHLRFLEVVRSISRYDIPVFSQKHWKPIRVLESKLLTNTPYKDNYTRDNEEVGGTVYSSASNATYGEKAVGKKYLVQKPAELIRFKTAFNRIVEPSVTLTEGIDFNVTAEYIELNENPFENDLWPKREIVSAAGELADRECTLWVYRGEEDWDYLYSQFGYALRLRMRSSEGYKQLINAILDSYSQGSSVRNCQLAISAVLGIPFVIEATETVEQITKDSSYLNIITDKHAYRFNRSANPVVSVGSIVSAGDSLTDNLQVFELNRGGYENIPAITIDNGILAAGFFKGLTFENKEVPIVCELGVKGKTKVSWDLGGFDLDVNKFWDDIHENGISSGVTLANLLDVRENPETEPTANSLPTTINPLKFLVENLLRGNAYVVKVKNAGNYENRLDFFPVDHIKRMQPPHTICIFIVELAYNDLPVIMESSGDATSVGYEEAFSSFPCSAISEVLDPESIGSYIRESVKIKPIKGRCI